MDLNITWFLLVVILIIGYAILDGFDLGVGMIHLFTKDEAEKRININSIGPVWDGNEVWLLTAGGALFAAFPIVYATVFSGFYLAFMFLLLALIFRAVSLEFRGKVNSEKWKKYWDIAFGLGSLIPAILYGVAIGNIIRGIPINELGMFTGNFFSLLNPFSITVGLLSLVLFLLHGSIYLSMKCEGTQQARILNMIPKIWMLFVSMYVVITIYTFFEAKYFFRDVLSSPLFYLFSLVLFGAVIYIPMATKSLHLGRAFTASSATITMMISLLALSLFPNLVPSNIDIKYSLTIYNASSTQQTLETMLYIALIGMPLVIGYTIIIYRIFKGKVKLDEHSY